MDLLSAEMIMVRNRLSQLPVVSEHARGHLGQPVGVVDMQCIMLACRYVFSPFGLQNEYRLEAKSSMIPSPGH